MSYDNGLLKTTFLNSTLINNLTCNNFNTSYLTDLISSAQGQLNVKQNIINDSSRLNALFVGTGNITNTIFDYLIGITSNIQGQLNLKQNIINDASRLNTLFVGTGKVSNTIFDYLIGVTSSIQGQFNLKQTIINASNKINCSFIGNGNITNTVLDYLSNVTSDIQSQINNIITGTGANNILYTNTSTFTASELSNVIFYNDNNFNKFIDPIGNKLVSGGIYSLSGAVVLSNLKIAQSITLTVRLRSGTSLISETTNPLPFSFFEYNGTNNSEFKVVTVIYPEFIFVSNSNYNNLFCQYLVNYNVDSINAETVLFNATMILKKLY
jgi:hypothetical protein